MPITFSVIESCDPAESYGDLEACGTALQLSLFRWQGDTIRYFALHPPLEELFKRRARRSATVKAHHFTDFLSAASVPELSLEKFLPPADPKWVDTKKL